MHDYWHTITNITSDLIRLDGTVNSNMTLDIVSIRKEEEKQVSNGQ